MKTVDEIVQEAKAGLTGETNVDMLHLENIVKQYARTEIGAEVESRIADLAYDILPEEKQEKLAKMLYLDGKRLDEVHLEALRLIKEKKTEEAFKLTEKLYTKILINYRETEERQYLSLRNPLEHQLYLYFYQPKKILERAPFDFSGMVMLHGYLLLDMGKPEEAISVLEDAIRFNPMNPDPYLEMAECYKILKQPEELLSVTKEIIGIAASPMILARCYCNLGYYCTEIKEYDDAVCFYYESLIFDKNDAITGELQYIHSITRKRIVPPTRKEVEAAFEKYGMKLGANEEVVAVTAALAKEAVEKKTYGSARFYLTTLYGLTNDKEVKDLLDRLVPKQPEA